MADPPEAEAPPGPGGVIQSSEFKTPSPQTISAGYQAFRRKEEEREAELQQQPFVAARESSRLAYAGDSSTEAEALFRSTFGETLENLNGEPGRLLSDVKVDQNLGQGSAVITNEGHNEILEAGMPIETENDEGETEKVDLSLEPGAEGFVPENPLVELKIGETAEEGVEIGEQGLTVTQAGAEESEGRLLGDKNVFFGEVEEGSSTDLMVSPTARGVELFDMLRSVESPETLRFQLELPEGDTLRPARGGGAELVSSEGSIIAFVQQPHGEDAQGTNVPVKMEIEGDSLVLRTEHREEDLAYPILIDPDISQSWGWWFQGQNLQGLGYWGWGSNIPGDRSLPVGETPWAGQWAGGLFAEIGTGETNAGNYAAFSLSAPRTSIYLHDVEVNPFVMYVGEGWPYREPFDFEGYYDVVQQHWNNGPNFDEARNQGYTRHSNWGHMYEFGMEVDVNNYSAAAWRYLAAGGVAFSLGDWANPTLTSVGAGPSGWVNATTPFSVSAYASDEGIGIKNISFTPAGLSTPIERGSGCNGTFESVCPTSYGGSFSFTGAGFSEGERQVQVSAQDAFLDGTNTATFTLKNDDTPPELHLHGQLETAVNAAGAGELQGQGGPELSQPIYNLAIEAADGSNADPTTKRSGVKRIDVLVDGTVKQSFSNASCAASSCPLSGTYALKLPSLAVGIHHLTVKAYDFAGNNPEERQIEFEYLPATGVSEEEVLQRFPLPDGKNHEVEGAPPAPELAVNVMNGNVVYHQRDIDVEGPDTNLEAELFYNALLPKEQSSEFGKGWTLSQTPSLKKAPSGTQATVLTSEAAMAGGVALPQEVGQEHFSDKLNAVITKEAGGGYAISEESGQESPTTVYNATGQTTEVQTSPTAGVEYKYASGKLAEIAVNDPGATTVPPPVKPAPSVVPNYVSSFGSTGTGSGQFSHPADVAVDSKGRLWVADQGNNRVEEFTPAGGFLKSLGSAGTGNGQFAGPKSLAFDAQGDLWVDDSGNSRLEEFNEAGTFLRAVGTRGSGNGQFSGPEGIAIDAKGNIWVSDTSNDRIEELNSTGVFIKVVNPTGLGAIEPTGIDAGPEGKIWVTDWTHARVVELSEGGELVRQFGSAGSAAGQLSNPDAVVVDGRGDVWIGDQGNNRVQEFNQEGKYIAQFGSTGSGAGQFLLSYPMGIATDNQGSLWIADTNNNRVQHWQVPHYGYTPTYASSFGAAGTGNGQFKHPGDVAADPEGNLWVADVENNRLEKFNTKGELLRTLGIAGTGNEQFKSPKSIAFTPDGNFWVADAGNNRLQEFTEGGHFIKAVGSAGTGNGQFNSPESLTIAPSGHLWVSDTNNLRIQELDENGTFIKVVNPSGLGAIEPTGIAAGLGGNIWVADRAHSRVVEISSAGALVRQIGSEGTGNGQFRNPDEVAVDARGVIWVGDQNNARVEAFSQTGEYLAQFGSAGTGAGQFSFSFPMGIAADGKGNLWVADTVNNRIQKWLTGTHVPVEEETAPIHDDPAVAVKTTSGLVTSVEGTGAGRHTYGHEGESLTSDEGPQGTTHYQYEAAGRLSKVTLPNGATASIEYDTTGRATKVTVTPAGGGAAKSTKFTYQQEFEGESRQTTVEPEGEKRTFYVIDNAGDVVRWWNAEVPPTFRTETGTFVEKREKELGVGDQTLTIEGHAAEGISKIEIITNGNTIVDEKTCTGTRTECENLTLQWIVNTEELAPGTLWVEAVLTDSLKQSASRRWWVTVPYIPPPPPGVPQPPKYKDVLRFREERGLDLDLNPVVNELELHERVIETLGAWHNPQTPLGEVAYAAWERWGVPLRPVDVAELEYRLAYIAQDVPLIQEWARAHAWSKYGGYYVDERAGGLLRVGFTENQPELLAQMKQELGASLAAPTRITTFPIPPTWTVAQVEGTAESIGAYDLSHSEAGGNIAAAEFIPATNKVRVEAKNIAAAEAQVTAAVGSLAHVEFTHSAEMWQLLSGRFRGSGPVKAGDYIRTVREETPEHACTAAFGVDEQRPPGQATKKFLLTAGHCWPIGRIVKRAENELATASEFHKVGEVVKNAFPEAHLIGETDGEAIALQSEALAPTQIYPSREIKPAANSSEWAPGQELCFSGATSGTRCGESAGAVGYRAEGTNYFSPPMRGIRLNHILANHGDSGSPVWNQHTGRAIGVLSVGIRLGQPDGSVVITPLKPLPTDSGGVSQPGILKALSRPAGPQLTVNPYME